MNDRLETQEFAAEDDALMLMSLALDDLLDSDDRARLDAMLAADADLRQQWRQWQKTDALFSGASMLCAVPQVGFVARFEQKLDLHERRRSARRRLFYGAAATVAWVGALSVVLGALWILVSTQTQWMNGFVRELVYYPSAVSIWVRALRSSLSATVSEPQSVAVVAAYALASAVLLSMWLWLLRRTTHEEVVS